MQDLSPKVIYEDSDLIVVVKPAGMIVNRADTTVNQPTVQEWAETKIKDLRSKIKDNIESEFYKRGGIVHRLDKETSGLLLIAKNEEAFDNLQAQFKSREVKKVYIALCHGDIKPKEGEVNVPIGRLPWNRTKFGFLTEGRQARTLYRVVNNYQLLIDNKKSKNSNKSEILSLVEVYPETGRTHQIRVHMRYIGHPVFADELYAGRKISKRDRKLLPRHFLHASKISFSHPRTGQSMSFESSLPADLQAFLDVLN